ncbi:hypothetical protein Hanom_Chr02g00153681 [Helianthus anomalus]
MLIVGNLIFSKHTIILTRKNLDYLIRSVYDTCDQVGKPVQRSFLFHLLCFHPQD